MCHHHTTKKFVSSFLFQFWVSFFSLRSDFKSWGKSSVGKCACEPRSQESCMSVFNTKASTGDGRKKEKLKDQLVHHIWPENDRDTILNKGLRKVIL